MTLNATETISTFTGFFASRGHHLLPGGSLVPAAGDPVLFTTSGMHPLTPYLEGRPHPDGRRLTGVQRCLRTTDLEEVGDEIHLTAFQMLGSWSLGDYEGPQSLRWGFELVTGGFGIGPDLLYATVFGGDEQVEPDLASVRAPGRPVRARLGDVRVDRRRPAGGHSWHRLALDGTVEPRDHAVPAAGGRQPGAAA